MSKMRKSKGEREKKGVSDQGIKGKKEKVLRHQKETDRKREQVERRVVK